MIIHICIFKNITFLYFIYLFTLNILLGSPKFLTLPQNAIAIQEQASKFECVVDALPKAKLTWYLNGKELTTKDNVKFETDAKTSANYLVIPKVNSTHLGTYKVKASNNVGEIEHEFNLDVLGIFIM